MFLYSVIYAFVKLVCANANCLGLIKAYEGFFKVINELFVRSFQCRMACNDDIVMSRAGFMRENLMNDRAQSAFGPVSFNGISYAFRCRKSDTQAIMIRVFAYLQH